MGILRLPGTDSGTLLRARDGIYADDLLMAAVGQLDLFTLRAEEPCDLDGLAGRLGLAHRPADVMCTLFRAMGLLQPGPTLHPTPLAAEHLVQGSPFDLRPYLGSLAQRPAHRATPHVERNSAVGRRKARPKSIDGIRRSCHTLP